MSPSLGSRRRRIRLRLRRGRRPLRPDLGKASRDGGDPSRSHTFTRIDKTAWLSCAKLRCSMLAPGRSQLAGLVEVDETEIACRSKNDPVTGGGGRSYQGKMLVVGAVEVEDGRRAP
jgi:hypothetical protein